MLTGQNRFQIDIKMYEVDNWNKAVIIQLKNCYKNVIPIINST